MSAQYVIGIDLGTTNCVLAYVRLHDKTPKVQVLGIPQLVAAGTIESHDSLPSFIYLAPGEEVKSGTLDLPHRQGLGHAVGQIARSKSAEVPDRSVVAAKSWLAHTEVDRHEPILPWKAPDEVPCVSPVTASKLLLDHVVATWNDAHPEALLADQQVVLTVPASFDASARELTREAAYAAGLAEHFSLLEEPQAAIYAWLSATGEQWREIVGVGHRILICDVGGGTTDLTLVDVAEENGELVLKRVAVGNHLLVGGDNMDLYLAHRSAQRFAQQGVKLDPWQTVALWHSCRAAKEKLLTQQGPNSESITVLGRGRSLIGGTVSVDVEAQEVGQALLDGFFPECNLTDPVERTRQSGFQDIGLPFESDTRITRHVAEFLRAHGGGSDVEATPSHVLFNGGVFRSPAFRERTRQVVSAWFEGHPVRPLAEHQDLDHAVARGAAYYGWAKENGGVRIRGGTARSYYVGIETAGLAIPGAPRPLRALCVVPHGMEEGTDAKVPSAEIGLVLGEPATFRFFSSATRTEDKPGDVLEQWNDEELSETDSLEATLPRDDAADESYVPVRFQSKVTELGILELWCANSKGPGRWKLEFSVRETNRLS